MNIETTFRELWATGSELCAILPVERVSVGENPGGTLPCATLCLEKTQPGTLTNAGPKFGHATFTLTVNVPATNRVLLDQIDALVRELFEAATSWTLVGSELHHDRAWSWKYRCTYHYGV